MQATQVPASAVVMSPAAEGLDHPGTTETVWITHCPDRARWYKRIAPDIGNPGECWFWTRVTSKRGYGVFVYRTGSVKRVTSAHRAAWLVLKGDIGPDLVVDHLCRNHRCINPEHLEPVTSDENVRRGFVSRGYLPKPPPSPRVLLDVPPVGSVADRVTEMVDLLNRLSALRAA